MPRDCRGAVHREPSTQRESPSMTRPTESDRVCQLLPFDGRMALVRASQTPGGEMARRIAIEQVVERVRAQFPNWFVGRA